jgi:tRNA A58 N-methylase Trm61
MAQAYPNSRFYGYDPHEASIAAARMNAVEAGVADRVTFATGTATDYVDDGFDLICFFDCLHDMGDPVAAARHARSALADGGTVMLVEPYAADAPDAVHRRPAPVRTMRGLPRFRWTAAQVRRRRGGADPRHLVRCGSR